MADEVKKFKVGVYGTLKNGYPRHPKLAGCTQLGLGHAEGFMLHLGSYPGLIMPREGMEFMRGNRVPVEIYEVTQQVLDELDYVEGHPDLFERRQVSTAAHGFFYVYYKHTSYLNKEEKTKVIMGGRWMGPTTPYTYVDFRGEGKPKIFPGTKQLLPVRSGSYEEVDCNETALMELTTNNRNKDWPKGPDVKYMWSSVSNCYIDKDGNKYRQEWSQNKGSTYVPIIEKTPEPIPAPYTISVPDTKKVLSSLAPTIELL